MVTTLATKKFSSPAEQTPRTLREMGFTLKFINLTKSALINVKERYDPSLYRFPVLIRANQRCVPVARAQV
jgi:hypothetical protein